MFVRAVVKPAQKYFFNNNLNLYRSGQIYKVKQLVESFEKFTGKNFYEYRAELRKLSQLTFDCANLQTILNTDTLKENSIGWNIISDSVWEQLRELPENSFVVPIDDDDWVCPNININEYERSSLCHWDILFYNSVTGRYIQRGVLEKDVLRTCSYAIASKVIVDAIKNNFVENKVYITNMLLKHGQALHACKVLEQNNFTKTYIENKHYGCRVLHLSNLSGATVVEKNADNCLIKNNKMTYTDVLHIRPPEKPKQNSDKWAMPYAELVYNINRRYYTRAGG